MRQDTTIRIPRWIQLVVLPVLLLVVFLLARPLGHVLFLFLTSAVIAFTAPLSVTVNVSLFSKIASFRIATVIV